MAMAASWAQPIWNLRATPRLSKFDLMSSVIAIDTELERETERLFKALLSVDCDPGQQPWTLERCRGIAPLTLEINRLKREKDAIILAHSYVESEIVYGVADFRGDSYFLSLKARESKARMI